MAKKNIIVYGLGDNFRCFKNQIFQEYNVIGVSDKNIEKGKLYNNFVSPDELKNRKDIDCILLTTSAPEILDEIVKETGISKSMVLAPQLKDITFYGQNMEDAVLLQIFQSIIGSIPICQLKYLEIGVCHPISINNTYLFYKKGARGILVDANPEVGELVSVYRPEDVYIEAAIGKQSQKDVEFYITKNRGLCSLSTANIEKSKVNNEGCEIEKIISVPLLGINDLLSQIEFDIDFVSIDIEGNDKDVLMNWDFRIQKPKVILVECVDYELSLHLQSLGYFYYTVVGPNSFFVDMQYRKKKEEIYDV